jgi:probable LLM family oxidoreductase
MELGIYSFADTGRDPRTGRVVNSEKRLRNLLEEIELADQVGLDVFGVGEHHRHDYAVPAPAIILAAAATRTKRIRLTSAVTVLSSADPIRVFQDFSMLDLISQGRAEIMVGRGAFVESFPLFGCNLDDHEMLFDEKLEILLKAQAGEFVTWSGRHRNALENLGVYPRPLQSPLPIWVGVGGTRESLIRAGTLGLPMALAIIGGQPQQFVAHANLYRQAGERAGHSRSQLKLAITSHGFVAETSDKAAETFFPHYAELMTERFRERGWPAVTRDYFDMQRSKSGAMIIGDPDEVVEKILSEHKLFSHDRFLLQPSMGTMPHEAVLRSIEIFGTKVAPRVRAALSQLPGPAMQA